MFLSYAPVQIDYIEFHNTKNQLATDTYEVVEHDGDISYARVEHHHYLNSSDVTWFTKAEYDDHVQQQVYNHRQDAALQDMFDALESKSTETTLKLRGFNE